MNKNNITIKDAMALGPYLIEPKTREFFSSCNIVTYLDIIKSDKMEHDYKLRLLYHCLSTANRVSFALEYAKDILSHEFRDAYDKSTSIVLKMTEKFLDGACSSGDLIAAADAAIAAAAPAYYASSHAAHAAYHVAYAAISISSPNDDDDVFYHTSLSLFYSQCIFSRRETHDGERRQITMVKNLLDKQGGGGNDE